MKCKRCKEDKLLLFTSIRRDDVCFECMCIEDVIYVGIAAAIIVTIILFLI